MSIGNAIENICMYILALFLFFCWMAGIVLAKGWAWKIASLFMFPAYYLVVEKILMQIGWVTA